jgi:hypothetical protein
MKSIGILAGTILTTLVVCSSQAARAQTSVSLPFNEPFEDTRFGDRGWYDAMSGALTTSEHVAGSSRSYECHFTAGASGCAGGDPGRLKFRESDGIYLSYWVKHSASWEGSGRTRAYHPHLFLTLTNLDSEWAGPACTHLTTYTEETLGYPQLCVQDGLNIDESRVGENLVAVTETRAVAGCNGTQSQSEIGFSDTSCYLADATKHWNGTCWKGPTATYFDSTEKTAWHHVESYFKLNTIAGGKGQKDGVVQYWLDGQLVIDHRNVILRTGQHPTMKFNQFQMLFYIGDGAPTDQYLWIDNLTLDVAPPSNSACPNNACDAGETCESCPQDCGPCCGNSTCDAGSGESCTSCPADCPTGNNQVCCSGALYNGDCCSQNDCSAATVCTSHTCQASPVTCGNGSCDAGETCGSCPQDCGVGADHVCCSDVVLTGDCCDEEDCGPSQTCANHTCQDLPGPDGDNEVDDGASASDGDSGPSDDALHNTPQGTPDTIVAVGCKSMVPPLRLPLAWIWVLALRMVASRRTGRR